MRSGGSSRIRKKQRTLETGAGGLDTSNLGCYTTCRSMGCRLTVGHLTLDQAVGVRIPAPQPSTQEAGHNARPLSFPRTMFTASDIRVLPVTTYLHNG